MHAYSRASPRSLGRRHLRLGLFAAILLVSLLTAAPSASARYTGPGPILNVKQVATAAPDACFGPNPGQHTTTPPPCPAGMVPQYHEQYAWGYASYKKWGYFGTGQVVCNLAYFGELNPFATKNATCEFGKGPAAPNVGPFFGDITQTYVYRIDSDTDQVTRLCCNPESQDPLEHQAALDLQYNGGGIRGGGAIQPPPGVRIPGLPEGDGVAMMFAPTLNQDRSSPSFGLYNAMALIAFDADTGKLLAVTTDPKYIGIRRTQDYDGWMYASARTVSPAPGISGGGVVLKWDPISSDGDTINVNNFFHFDTVFNLAAPPANSGNDAQHIAMFGNRIVLLATTNFVGLPSSKPGYGISKHEGSQVWLSPPITSPGGLTPDSQNEWKSIFNYKNYDPDPVRGVATPLGWATGFDGQLVVGSYSTAPMTTFSEWTAYHGADVAPADYHKEIPTNFFTKARDFLNAEKAISIFAIKNPGTARQSVRLLYGNYRYPVYNGTSWKMKVNLLGQRPKFGSAGYDNFLNDYSWTWVVQHNRLYMGTFDATIPGNVLTPMAAQVLALTPAQEKFINTMMSYSAGIRREQGFDLLRFDDLNHPARIETVRGFGHKTEYGLRSLFQFPNTDKFYMGSAGTENLENGWSIFKLTPNENGPVAPVRHRAVLEPVLEATLRALEAGSSLASQVRAGHLVNFNVTLFNMAPLPVTGARVCIKPPAGYRPAAGSGACVVVDRVPAKGSKTVVVRMIAGDQSGTGTATATGQSWAGGCGGIGAVVAEGASVGMAPARSDNNCQEELATNAGFPVDAKATVRVRSAAGAPPVTG